MLNEKQQENDLYEPIAYSILAININLEIMKNHHKGFILASYINHFLMLYKADVSH